MEMLCAACGCLVDRGVRVIPCESSECCCLQLPTADPMEMMAARIRIAFNSQDMDAFRSLIAEDAKWGEDPDHPNTCHNRNDIIATYQRHLVQGVRGHVAETTVGPSGVMCLLEIEWPDPDHAARGPSFFQVFVVRDRLITKIEGHDDRELALASISI
jgi:hypothetical protein